MSADAINTARPLLHQVEGIRLDAYPDPLSGGDPWTIGYGCTSMLDGRPVRKGDRLASAAEADALLLHVLGLLQPKLRSMVHVALEPCQEGALLSFQFNEGTGALHGSTLLRLLNAGDRLGAAEQLLQWDKGHVDGKLVVVPDLKRRRELERAVFLGKVDLLGSVPIAERAALAAASSKPLATTSVARITTADLNDAELARVQLAGRPA